MVVFNLRYNLSNMKYEGIFQGEQWRENETLSRKKHIMDIVSQVLDAHTRAEQNLDSPLFIIKAEGINTDGNLLKISFDIDTRFIGLEKTTYSIVIRDENGGLVYRLDKTICQKDDDEIYRNYNSIIENSGTDSEINDRVNEVLESCYELDERENVLSYYNDNWSETNIDAKQAEDLLDGFRVLNLEQITQ